MPTSRTTIILIVLGLLVLGAAAYLLFGSQPSESAVSPAGTPGSEAEMTFLGLTAQIDPVAFDTSVLDDPRFKALRDIRTAILPEAPGRADPFAPLGAQ